MKKIAGVLEKSILALFLLIYISTFLINIIFQKVDFYRKKTFILPVIGFAVLVILTGMAGMYLYQKKKDKIEKYLNNSDRIVFLASIVLLVIQWFICLHIYFMTGWDSGIITANADYVAKGQTSELWNWYYSRCPNNSLLTGIYAVIFWVVEHLGIPSTAVRLLIVFGQCVLSVWTGYLAYRCGRKFFKERIWSVLIWIFYVFLLGLSPWLVIPYSDSTCLFMPILIFWLYQTLENGKAKYGKCVCIGILSYLGYEIKPMVIIITIAIIGVEFLQNIKEKCNLKRWSVLAVICISLIGTMGVCKVVNLEKIMGFEINQEAEFGLTHYLMMGLNEEHSGVFIVEDAEYSESIPTLKERKKENIRVAKERIKNFGFIGLCRHTVKKSMVNFSDGTFAWGQEGDFYGIPLALPDVTITQFLRNIFYDTGRYHVVFETVVQFFWIAVLVGLVLNTSMLFQKKKQDLDKTQLVMMAALIGIALFVMIFEARARYLFVYVPVYIFMAVQGYRNACCLFMDFVQRDAKSSTKQ